MTKTTITHYKILGKLGKGGMGEVYKAEDSRLGRVVALKFLADIRDTNEYHKRFEKEARAAAALNHPNICTIYAIEEHNNEQFIAMEYVDGTTLREIINSGELDTEQAIDYGIQIASALGEAHDKGIIHRDLKPENIMVDPEGRIKVMDFGLALIQGTEHITRKEVRIGTAAYMSPEQLRGEEVDLQSDLFSFGIILYEMFSGRHPFQGEYEQAITYRLLNEDPPLDFLSQSKLPGLDKLILQCLEKKPKERCPSAQNIRKELMRFQKESHSEVHDSAGNGSQFSNLLSPLYRKHQIAAGGLVLLVLIAGMWWYDSGFMDKAGWESIPEEKHLIVLPFNNLSGDVIPASFSDGILEILTSKITQMGSTKSLWVVPNSEVRSEQVSSVTEAEKLFGTNMAVTGSFHRTGDHFQLTLNLVDGSSLRQLRSTVLELEWADFSMLQDEAVKALAEMLEIELIAETEHTITAGHSQNSRAYRLFIEGRGFLSRYEDPESVDEAIEKFEQALDADPEYARALAGLGEAYWRKFNLTNDVQWTEPALKYVHKALEINDQLTDVHVTLAMIYNGMGRYEDALDLLEQLAQQEEPGYEIQIEFAKAYSGMGKTDRAEVAYLKAIDIKETFWDAYNQLGFFYYGQGRYKDAVNMFQKVTEWTPDSYSAYYRLGAGYFSMERNREAEEALKKSLQLRPNYRAFSNLGTMYLYEGRHPEAIQMFEQALKYNDADYRIWGNLGFAYYWTGENQEKVHSTFLKAIEMAETMMEVTPEDDFLLAQLANYYAMIDNREQVRYLLGQLISKEIRDPTIMVAIADAYEMLEERRASLLWIENALEQGYAWENLKDRLGLQNLLKDPQAQKLREKYE